MTGVALTASARATGGRASARLAALAMLATAALGWVLLARRMAGMSSVPGGDPGSLAWFVPTWALMTAAMMAPVIAPAAVRLRSGPDRSPLPSALSFLAGYALVWMLAGVAGFGAVAGVRTLHVSALRWDGWGRYLAGATVAAAGVYQLTAAKSRWLGRCRARVDVLDARGAAGGLRAGLRRGVCCVSCCWSLMAALYALGMMSLAWTALLTVAIAAERTLPRPEVLVRAIAALLVVLGLAVAAVPASVPMLGASRGGMRMAPSAPPRSMSGGSAMS